MPSFDFKKYLPHVYVILAFAVISVAFCLPAFQGKVLSQGDVNNWKGMYHETEVWHEKTGENPLWTNSMFGGMPTYTIGIPESSNLLSPVLKVITTILVKPAYFFFLAMLFFYILMLAMRVDKWLGAIGALAFAFATYNPGIIVAGHDTKMMAIAFMPGVLAGLIVLYRNNIWGGAALLGISLALLVGANHFQVDYYMLIIVGFYILTTFISYLLDKKPLGDFFKASLVGLVVAAISVGPSMASILSTKEYTKMTMRGGQSELTLNKKAHDLNKANGGLDKDYAFRWSNGIGETFCILVPYLYGGSSGESISKAPESETLVGGQADRLPLYWGPQPFLSGPIYFGAIVCFLFVLGMMVVKSRHKWWILVASLIGIMLSWGDHLPELNYFLFDHLPMYNKFRTPTMTMIIPQMLFPMLGIWGLSEIISGKTSKEELWKHIKIAAGITAGLALLLGVGGSMFFKWTNPVTDAQLPEQLIPALKNDRQALAMHSGLTSAVYILIAAGLLWAFVKEKINKTILLAGIGILTAIDLFVVANNYLNENSYVDESDYQSQFTPRPVDEEIMKDTDPYYRVLDLSKDTYNDALQCYFHKCVGGYSPAKMEIYQDLIDMHMGGQQSQGKFNSQVLNMLNTKYIIFNGPQKQAVYQPNPMVNGNAWFVNEAKVVKTADEEMLAMKAQNLGDTAVVTNAWDSKNTAIIREGEAKQIQGYTFGKDSAAAIKLSKYGLNSLSFTSNNSKNGLAVFSDIWYPYGWEATVDGKPTPIMRVNYVLRAIKVDAGKHNIEFKFRPASYMTGDKIALFSSIILIVLVLLTLWMSFKNNNNSENDGIVAM